MARTPRCAHHLGGLYVTQAYHPQLRCGLRFMVVATVKTTKNLTDMKTVLIFVDM